MIKKSFIFVFAMFFIAIFSLRVVAQTIPDGVVKAIGYTQPTGGPPVAPFTLDPTDHGWFYSMTPDPPPSTNHTITMYRTHGNTGAITCQFPPVADANQSATIVVYKQAELGINSSATLSRMQIPVVMDVENDGPYSIYLKIPYTNVTNYLNHQPTPIRIYIKNGAAFSARGEQDVELTTTTGWTNVFDGEWNPSNGQLEWNGISDTALLTIDFTTLFDYTGGDISVVFQNRVGIENPSIPSAFQAAPADFLPYWNYRFKCFKSTASSYTDTYYGPKISYSNYLYISYWMMADAVNSPGALYYPATWEWIGYDNWYPSIITSTPNVNKYTASIPLAVDPNGPGPSTENASVRPNVFFTVGIQSLNEPTYTASIINTGRDTLVPMTDINLNMKVDDFPLKLKRIKFNAAGTKEGLVPNVKFYYTATGTYADTVLLGTMQPEEGENVFYLPIPKQLAHGDNRFLVVYEIPKPTVANGLSCGDALVFNFISYTLGDRAAGTTDNIDHEVFVDEEFTKNIQFEEAVITNLDNKERRICFEEATTANLSFDIIGNAFGGRLAGTYLGFQWERSTDGGATWEDGIVSTDSVYVIPTDDTYNAYRGTVIAPNGCSNNPFVVYNIIWEHINTGATVEYTGELSNEELQQVQAGTSLRFGSEIELGANSVASYRWQVNINNTGWMEISGAINPTMTYVPQTGISGNYAIRLRLDAAKPTCQCNTIVYSNVVQFRVAEQDLEFVFIDQPPSSLYLCSGGNLSLMVSYAGKLDPTRSCWQKDGQDLLDISGNRIRSRFLNVASLNLFSGGEYRYKAVDTVTNLINGDYVMDPNNISYSEVCRLTIVPTLEIYYVSQSHNYVMPGNSAAFTVYSSFVDNEEGSAFGNEFGFQWYKHTENGNDVRLSDDYYYKGTRSNVLVITEAPHPDSSDADDIYTFNGAYYYLVINGPCGRIDSKSHPIFLHSGEGIEFIKNNTDVLTCAEGENGRTAEFEVIVQTEDIEFIRYQWYVEGIAVGDGADIEGSTTSKLTLKNLTSTDIETYCRVSAFINNYWTDINSDMATIDTITMTLTGKSPTYDEIKIIDVGTVGLMVETNNPGSAFYLNLVIYDTNDSLLNNVTYDETFLPGETGQTTQKTFEVDIIDLVAEMVQKIDLDLYKVKMTVTNDCGEPIMQSEWTIDATAEEAIDNNSTTIVENNLLNNLVVTPNPTSNMIFISYNSAEETPTSIELCGLAGNTLSILFDGICDTKNNFEFDLSKLNIASGTYILKISNKNGLITKQFVFVR